MTNQISAKTSNYLFVPANSVEEPRLLDFAAAAWPDRPADRVLSSWWRRAEPHCAVAAIHQKTGAMAGICGGRPSQWKIGDREVSAVAICEWYVAPGHEGKALGKRMVRSFTTPDNFLYAFSLTQAAVDYLKVLGWRGPWQATLLALPLPRLVKVPLSLFSGRAGAELRDHIVTNGQLSKALCVDLDRIELVRTRPAHMRRDSKEWSWRLSFRPDLTYHICIAYRSDEPIGYVAVRRLTPDRSRLLRRLDAALIIDLVVVDDDRQVLRALTRRAVAIAGELNTRVVVATTTVARYANALASQGFISSSFPIVGRFMKRVTPQFMWSPQGPGAEIDERSITITFADSDVDMVL